MPTSLTTFHWRSECARGNFGDALTLLFLARVLDAEPLFRVGTLHLVGSVITQNRLAAAARDGFAPGDGLGRAIFWGCGKKDPDPLPAALVRRAILLGVRGALTRDALGLPRHTPLGDTALLLPRFYAPRPSPETRGRVVFVPHVHHPVLTEADFAGCPDPVVLSPAIPNTAAACEGFIDAVASARFVMANAMHAAVVALAYGVPFAFWGGRYVNHPFKWADFGSGVGFALPFVADLAEGRRQHDAVRPDRAFAAWDPAPLLDVAPARLRTP